MTATPASIQAKTVAMRSACGMREPDQVEINQYNQGGGRLRYRAPGVITSCDPGGCWDSNGERYNRGAGNTLFPANGSPACQVLGNQLHCP